MRHEVLDHVAGRMHVPGSLISRLREGKAGLVERLTTDEQRLAIYTAQEVFAIASKGDVVLRGWGATCLLRPVRHVVRVRVTRSLSKRVEWLMGHLETDDAAFAEAEVRRSDDAHSLRMHEQFGVTWGDPVLYDLTLNTDRLSVESCVAQILQLTGRPEFQETGASRAMLKDLALNARIRAAFKDYESTRGVNIQIESQGGKVVLSGIVLNTHESTEAARIAATLPGVDSVDNQLRLMTTSRRFTSAKY
ncbi:MAG: transporter [Polaromonas sp. 35-63-240]|nr:MAG: transporter [Polaromonas sp. 35-63-240]